MPVVKYMALGIRHLIYVKTGVSGMHENANARMAQLTQMLGVRDGLKYAVCSFMKVCATYAYAVVCGM